MMPATQRLRSIELKLERARKHRRELSDVVKAYLASKPFAVGARKAETGPGIVYFVSSISPPPEELAIVAGDAIQCLVTTLDHLAYQLVSSDTGDSPPAPSKIYFPVANSFEEYEAMKSRKLQGAHPATVAAIDALTPFKGGNEPIWALHQLNIIDKHRTLLTTGSSSIGTAIWSLALTTMREQPGASPDTGKAIAAAFPGWTLKSGARFPLLVGEELLRDSSKETVDVNYQFHFGVGIHEPGIFSKDLIGEALKSFDDAVVDAIEQTKHRL